MNPYTYRLLIYTFPVIIFFLTCYSSITIAQPKKNIIILWDVTASMVGTTPKGYNANKNIDQKVRSSMTKLIEGFANDNSSIRIMPFKSEILDFSKVYSCNANGKSRAKSFVAGYSIDPEITGGTNICSAWETAHKYLNKSCMNYIYLFTDGEQNIPYGDNHNKNCMPNLIEKYCNGTSFTYYISIDAKTNFQFPKECGDTIRVTGEDVISPPPLPDSQKVEIKID